VQENKYLCLVLKTVYESSMQMQHLILWAFFSLFLCKTKELEVDKGGESMRLMNRALALHHRKV